MSPGQQISELLFSSVTALLSGFFSTFFNALYTSFIQPLFEGLARSLGVPIP